MSSVLSIDKVKKSYSGVPAVKEMSLSLREGEFVTLLGPSGCGKSTTLRMIGGFETPDAGTISIEGRDCTSLPPHKRNVNIVFQDYALFPHLTVARNVAFGLELKGMGRAAINARVREMLELVKLTDFAERMPAELSGGQRQRVALARALAPNPPVLLLDEPLSALDAKLRKEMQIELRRLQRETGKTFILVTHDQEEALTMSDTIVVMSDGEVDQIGTPWDLYNAPATEFVARFIGEMNLLPVSVTGSGDHGSDLEWRGALLRARTASALGASGLLGIRPEHIRLSAAHPGGDAHNVVQGKVVNRVFRGSNVSYVVLVNGTEISATAPQRTLADHENDVWLHWDSDHSVLLAIETMGVAAE